MVKWHKRVQRHETFALFGFAGVSPKESKRARAWSAFFSYAVVIVAIILLMQWQMELLHQLTPPHRQIINTVVWSFFVLNMLILLIVVKDRWRYLRQNWLLPIIILLGLPFLMNDIYVMQMWRGLRPLLAIFILIPSFRFLVRFFIDGQLKTTLLAAAIIVIIFGLLVAGVDPNIKTPWDGIWWAVSTVSTVGYGDVVPSSALGRLLGVGLIVMGLGIFVVITANFLALILKKEVDIAKKREEQVSQILGIVQSIQSDQEKRSATIDKIAKRLETLESKE